MFKLSIILLLSFNISWAACSQSVKYLAEGTAAPCSGYLFSPEKEQEVRTKIEQFDPMEKLVKNQDQQIDILNQRLTLAQQQNLHLEQFVQNRSDTNVYINLAFFVGGALITAFIASNVNR